MNHRRTTVAAVTATLAVVLAGCGTLDEDPAATPAPTTEPSPSAEPSEPTPTPTPTTEPEPTETATAEQTVTAYYLVDTRTGLRLARETRDVAGDDPLVAAVEAMISGAEDPDYSTSWAPGTEVLSVTEEAGLFTVDLSEEARTANIGSEGAALMIQQLVWTVTDTADDDGAGVALTIEGEPAGELWGAVTWDGPVMREEAIDVRLLVQIDEPAEGATVTSPVTVTGEAAVFEANLPWSVLDDSGAEVQTGFTMTAEGQTFAPYSFDVELEPGTWTIVITEDDPSDGAAGEPMTDSRTVTVE
ncbi:Gmad2 immunoglobulin-like domain-containing protein [Actinotalea sp. Marseille-Q4924]|uniref:Gmad2 immunoglobulin-like domain-containing protein n=1 Tax=Actinotalea sp. Marseille-Q4924 TaxID=2866571 RepID=UPI001CE43A67|nr:Gmad2 immunoglobulin-like domain-containing protein [Actinotalea sp. Marseille-Q4924]